MTPAAQTTLRYSITGLAVLAALAAGDVLWEHYQADPWTRDGRVRAEIVQIAPDVPGLVTQLNVHNDQPVHKGDVLFVVDEARYALALRQSEDALAKAQVAVMHAQAAISRTEATLAEARREAVRNARLGDLVAQEATEASQSKVAENEAALAEANANLADAKAQVAAAQTNRDLARLNLSRTRVLAPMDGVLSDVSIRPGDVVAPAKPVLALVDTASLRIEGYFEETRLPHVRVGQKATVRLMGEDHKLYGHVTSIATAIEDHDRTGSPNMLPAINPSFSWVRLAQRVPVRITLDHPPANVALIIGRTATVALDGEGQR